ncbi:MAG TPA: ABC transporter substrate-binding protein [Methanomicrobia archaeon]|nr:ABC transporter substrate-binding protein [Methanomicrobia archaeon]
MRAVTAGLALLILLLCMASLSFMPAAAAGIPGDDDGNGNLDERELVANIFRYLHGTGDLSLEDLRDAAHVYVYWNGAPRSIVDTAGRTVTIYRPVKKIVVLSSDGARAIQILGAEHRVVGISETVKDFSFYFPATSQQPVVGTWKEVDWETIVALHPDLLIVSPAGTINVNVAEDKLKGFDITVVGFYLYVTAEYDQIFEELEELAFLLEKEHAAARYIAWHNGYLAQVEEFVTGREKPEVFLTYTSGAIGKTSDISSYGPGSTLYLLAEKAGARPITEYATTGYPKVNAEWVLAKNPDTVIMICGNVFGWWNTATEPANLLQQLMAGKSWGTLNATVNNQIYAVPWSVTNGFEHTYGFVLLAKLFHPELPIEPGHVSQEFLEEFLRVEYPGGEGKVLAYSGVTTLRT